MTEEFACNRIPVEPGVSLHYATRGTGSETVVLLHGYAANLQAWHDLALLFPPDRYTLHLLDLKGSGKSDKPLHNRYSMKDHAGAITAFLEKLDLSEVTLAGQSMGGAIALIAAVMERGNRQTSRIKRLVLIGAPAYPQKFPKFLRLLRLPVLPWLMVGLTPSRMIAKRGLQNAYRDPGLADARHVSRYASGYSGFRNIWCLIRTVRTMVPEDCDNLISCYPTLTIPTLLIWGSHDRIVPPWQGKRLQEAISGSRLVILPECGHNPHEEFPRETYEVIEEFIRGS